MFLNLKLVKIRGNMFGQIIARDFTTRPAEVLQMIREQFREDPEKVIETISPENAAILGLVNPLDRFRKYFPVKECALGVHGLVYDFKNFQAAFEALKRAKAMIGDLGLNLEARAISKRGMHKVYIDQL